VLFTFKRDSEGRETIYIGDVPIARPNDFPEGMEWIGSPPPGVTADHLQTACAMADEAGFWERRTKDKILSGYYEQHLGMDEWLRNEVTVDVPIPETTSTILSITNAEDRS
jgi:hypothetical protein